MNLNTNTDLFSDGLLRSGEELEQAGQRPAVDDDLGLDVVSGDDVADRPQRRADHTLLVVHQQLHDPPAHAAVYHSLDLVVGAVREVGERPARVRQHVAVVVEQEAGQHGQGGGHLHGEGQSSPD